jgi:hypothetical protein
VSAALLRPAPALDDAFWVARMNEDYRRHGIRRVVVRTHLR